MRFHAVLYATYGQGGIEMKKGKIIQLEERVPKLKKQRQKRKRVNRRLILYVAVLFLLVLFVMYFRSPLSNIAHINVQGSHYMDDKEVMKLSGITYKTSYFRVKPREAEAKLSERKEVQSVQVEKMLPNRIMITIKEYKTTGYVYKKGKLYPLLENGKMLSALPDQTLPVAAPILFGFKEETYQEMSSELIKMSPSIFRSISEIHLSPKASDPLHLTLYMNEGYEVSTTVQGFSEKMATYPLIIKTLKPDEKVRINLELGAYTERLNTGEKAQ